MHFSIYKDNIKLTSEETYVAVADSHNNGNYTCKVETASVAGSFVKESQTIVVKAKGGSSNQMTMN